MESPKAWSRNEVKRQRKKETHDMSHGVNSHIPMLPFTLVNLVHSCQYGGFINQMRKSTC